MLENLNKVEWSKVKSGFRSSEDISFHIRQLTSEDRLARENGLRYLEGHINQEGIFYEATPLVIPFLIELLAIPTVQDKDQILYCLELIAPLNYWMSYSHESDFARWQKPAILEIAKGIPVYCALLEDQELRVRAAAARLLSRPAVFPTERLAEIGQRLRKFVENEQDFEVKVFGIDALSEFLVAANHRAGLQGGYREYVDFFKELLLSGEPEPLPFMASVAYARVAGEQTPDFIIERFLEVVTDSHLLTAGIKRVESVVPGCSSFETLSHLAIWHLGQRRRIAVMAEALKRVTAPPLARSLAYLLLIWTFTDRADVLGEEGKPTRNAQGKIVFTYSKGQWNKPLTALQKEAVRIVLEADIVWRDAHDLLALFGLPSDRGDAYKSLE